MRSILNLAQKRVIYQEPGTEKPVSLLNKEDIRKWSNKIRSKTEAFDPINAICAAIRAIKLWRSWDLTIVQIMAILLGLSQSNGRNLFMEISTGSGKSLVIAVIAVVKALQGKRVV